MVALRFEVGSTVTPGDRLGSLRHVSPGPGTYARGGHVFSCLVGKLAVKENDTEAVVSVQSHSKTPALQQVLTVGQLVLCRVQKIMMQQANVEIIAAERVGRLSHKPDASIRRDDVRNQVSTSTGEDLLMENCFRPNDWVLGRIISLGDSRRYLISTAETELGVVRAMSSQHPQEQMKPLNWKEMECPVSGKKESRKVAKQSKSLNEILIGSDKQI
mmetsp:Transcript_30415/g.46040  ORF Transcript_30415/g.46040 Transcript_30415/m.46040 type:complete len:216 (-) Transcript_30415:203-850(-)